MPWQLVRCLEGRQVPGFLAGHRLSRSSSALSRGMLVGVEARRCSSQPLGRGLRTDHGVTVAACSSGRFSLDGHSRANGHQIFMRGLGVKSSDAQGRVLRRSPHSHFMMRRR